MNSEMNLLEILFGEINDFHKKLNANSYLIIEPNIEIFKLSMFMTDYTLLAKDGTMTIQIDDNEYARLYLLMVDIFKERNLKTIG